jgi:hypothetical protein
MPACQETDDDAKRESRGERGNRTLRHHFLNVAFFLAEGLAELVSRRLDLIGEGFGASL